jgi:hypothetical protein
MGYFARPVLEKLTYFVGTGQRLAMVLIADWDVSKISVILRQPSPRGNHGGTALAK